MNRRATNQLLSLATLNAAIAVDLPAGEATIGFDVRGMPAGNTAALTIEATTNGQNWSPLTSAGGTQTITADGSVTVMTAGLHSVRLRVSAAVANATCYVSYNASSAAAPPPSTFSNTAIDTVALTTANQAQQMPNIPMALGGSIQNLSGDAVYIGTSNAVTSGGAHGWKLAPGQVLGVAGSNLNAYWFNGPASGDVLAYAVN